MGVLKGGAAVVDLLSVFAFALALSMDGFAAGIVYGTRNIRIPLMSLVVIGITSSTAIGVSMFFGHFVSNYVSVKLASVAGSLILILMGLRMVILTWSNSKIENAAGEGNEPGEEETKRKAILKFKIKSLGLVIQILQEPAVADLDKSGHINTKEALLLSLALAMDALVAGFGAAMTGFEPLLTPVIVGPASAFWVGIGVYVGKRYAANWLGGKAAILPGWLLICLGLVKVIKI